MMGAIWQHCVPRVADEDDEDEDGATRQPETSRRSVSFGQVMLLIYLIGCEGGENGRIQSASLGR